MSIFEKYGKLPFTVNKKCAHGLEEQDQKQGPRKKDQEFFYKMMG